VVSVVILRVNVFGLFVRSYWLVQAVMFCLFVVVSVVTRLVSEVLLKVWLVKCWCRVVRNALLLIYFISCRSVDVFLA